MILGQINQKKNEVVYRDRGYFETKSKGHYATIKKAVTEHPLEMDDILRNRGFAQKEFKGDKFMQ